VGFRGGRQRLLGRRRGMVECRYRGRLSRLFEVEGWETGDHEHPEEASD
jgi:hypothetical protein